MASQRPPVLILLHFVFKSCFNTTHWILILAGFQHSLINIQRDSALIESDIEIQLASNRQKKISPPNGNNLLNKLKQIANLNRVKCFTFFLFYTYTLVYCVGRCTKTEMKIFLIGLNENVSKFMEPKHEWIKGNHLPLE